ncbi:MAG: hypothetical protein SFZ03_01490 [Candidatus Melainabacteria bacterium]|nr:hypothetical protein [Candidatus Melainabacteria bacterium]
MQSMGPLSQVSGSVLPKFGSLYRVKLGGEQPSPATPSILLYGLAEEDVFDPIMTRVLAAEDEQGKVTWFQDLEKQYLDNNHLVALFPHSTLGWVVAATQEDVGGLERKIAASLATATGNTEYADRVSRTALIESLGMSHDENPFAGLDFDNPAIAQAFDRGLDEYLAEKNQTISEDGKQGPPVLSVIL